MVQSSKFKVFFVENPGNIKKAEVRNLNDSFKPKPMVQSSKYLSGKRKEYLS
jgi:hypothetical protein